MAAEEIPVRPSSQVASATYDADEEVMVVSFKSNGAVYRYNNVDQETADAMANTPWNDMKAGLLDYERIS